MSVDFGQNNNGVKIKTYLNQQNERTKKNINTTTEWCLKHNSFEINFKGRLSYRKHRTKTYDNTYLHTKR